MAIQRHTVDAIQFATASIARTILTKRTEADLSQGAVARKAKIRQETLSRLEHGHGNPTVNVIERIIWAIECLDKRNTSPRTLSQIQTSESRKKLLRVELNNTDLNALEDLLYCDLTPRHKRLAQGKAKRLWHILVTAWDNPPQTPQQPAAKRPRAVAGS